MIAILADTIWSAAQSLAAAGIITPDQLHQFATITCGILC